MSEHKKTRKRSSYHNVEAYDDELDLVLELLEESKPYEEALAKQFQEAFDKLLELYERVLPFYFKTGLNNKKMMELANSLYDDKGRISSDVDRVLNEIKRETFSLEVQYLTAWLIIDYETTARTTAKAINLDTSQLLMRLSFGQAQKTIEKPWCDDKKTYIQRIEDITSTMDKQLRMVIVQGIRRGWSVERMTEIFRNITGAAEYKARRLIRTETMAVYSKVTKDIYLEKGIEYVEIIGDAACGGICLDYVDTVIPLADADIGIDLPPYHPNCCCSFCCYEEYGELDSEEETEDFEE